MSRTHAQRSRGGTGRALGGPERRARRSRSAPKPPAVGRATTGWSCARSRCRARSRSTAATCGPRWRSPPRPSQRPGDEAVARAELAALKSQLSFFSGAYADALSHAEAAMALADDVRRPRRCACSSGARPAWCSGTVGVPGWAEWLQETLALSIAAGDGWQEAISRNDLACWHQREGRLAEAEAEIARGIAVARRLERRDFALGILHSTRADIRLLASRPDAALADAERALAYLCAQRTEPVRLRRHRPRAGPGAVRARPARRRAAVRRGRARPARRAPPARAQHRARHAGGRAPRGRADRGGLRGPAPQRRRRARGPAGSRRAAREPRAHARRSRPAVRPERRARGARAPAQRRPHYRARGAARSSSASRPTATG